jgi:predicted phosphodiesterase
VNKIFTIAILLFLSETSAETRFVAIGDTGKANLGQQKVADALSKKCLNDKCDFIIFLGDLIYPTGPESEDDPQFNSKLVNPYNNIEAIFYIALGNHDYGSGGLFFSKSDYYLSFFKNNSKWKFPNRFYHLSHGFVDIFVLDTNRAMFKKEKEQREYFKELLSKDNNSWRIAAGHHPYFSNGTHGNAGNYEDGTILPFASGSGVKDFLENTICGKVDVFISGHDHSLQWLTPTCDGTELIVSGAGANPTKVKNRNEAYFSEARLGFLYCVAKINSLTCEFIYEKGNSIFSRTIFKK